MKLGNRKDIRRLVIFFFYDKDGVVDRYVPYMLNDVRKNCSELFVVVNGKLTGEGREILGAITPKLFVRDNVGYDVWAYKEALACYGWEALAEFDEVVMMNHTLMGPIYPFEEMFAEMNERDVDFWGITKHHKMPYDPFGTGIGKTYEHIQSHFIAVRKPMLTSLEFRDYWENRPEISSYTDAIGKHEAIFTKKFADAGYHWEVYIDTSDLEGFTYYPLQKEPVRMLRDYRCPVFKRRSFFQEYETYLSDSAGDQARKLMAYLRDETDYDVDMIWENILRTSNMADIKLAMDLDYVLPKQIPAASVKKHRVALVIHQYFDDLIDYTYRYALSMPKDADVYITTNNEKKADAIRAVYEKGPWNSVKVIVIENRGRDVSSLLVGVAPYVMDYDLVCFMHDKKVQQLDWGIKGYYFSERCFENLIGSKELVSQIIALFDREPRLGLLCPPPPNHADYYPQLSCEWGPNFKATKELADELEITIPMSEEKEPVAPLGTMFWFRTKALKRLFDRGWKYEDFPEEPNKNDGTILHAVERIYTFTAQQEGFYSAWVLSDEYMRTEWTNLYYMLRAINKRVFPIFGLNSHFGLISTMDYRVENGDLQPSLRIHLKRKLKKLLPGFIWKPVRKIYRTLGGKKWVG